MDLDEETPLTKAVYCGFERTARLLLNHDAVNIHELEDGSSILKTAILSGQTGIVKMLLKYGFSFKERYCNRVV